MAMSSRRAQRGQTMALLAITLLFLGLMATFTLGVGMRIRQRMETQVAADTAAFSEAVATARALNMMSTLNRTQTSWLVAMAAKEALISYSGQLRGVYYDTDTQVLRGGENVCAGPSACEKKVCDAFFRPSGPWRTFEQQWAVKDGLAGDDTRNIQSIADVYTGDANTLLTDLVSNHLANQTLASQYAAAVQAVPALTAPPGAAAQSVGAVTQVIAAGQITQHFVMATMGERGNNWVANRKGPYTITNFPINSGEVVSATISNPAGGGAGFGSDHELSQTLLANSLYAWGDDDGPTPGTVTFCGKTHVLTSVGHADVKSIYAQDDQSFHDYDGNSVLPFPNEKTASAQALHHRMGPYVSSPGMWPFFMDYDPGGRLLPNKTELFGQPVMQSMVVRDFSTSDNVWNLDFSFRFGATTNKLDNGSKTGLAATNNDFRYQVGIATGVVYYHRPDFVNNPPVYFKEPPTLMNPFWRATLMSAQQYKQGAFTVGTFTAAGAQYNGHSQTFQQLQAVGFKGIP